VSAEYSGVLILEKWFKDRSPLWMKKETKERIKRLGNKGDTYDDILDKIISTYENSRSPTGENPSRGTQRTGVEKI
jgi:hypothetical protein